MTDDKTGRIVWHDLFTGDRQRSMAFYQRVAGWTYKVEHATDFAWGDGEKDFVLALLGDEAGAGFAETPPELTNGWIAYVEVRDVDAAVALAEELGGTITRQPFEVPGVGRNALLRDPLGASFGVSVSRHSFPAPRRQFGIETYLSDATAFPRAFYSQLLGWKVSSPPTRDQDAVAIAGPSGEDVAVSLVGKTPADVPAIWLPSLNVADPQAASNDARILGGTTFGRLLAKPDRHAGSFLCDPDGALFRVR